MLRHSAGALSLSSFGREKALKLERASVWTSRCCCCQLSTLDRTPEEKTNYWKAKAVWACCWVIQDVRFCSSQTKCMKQFVRSVWKIRALGQTNVNWTFTDTVYIILMSSLRLIITSTHSFFSSTRTTQSPEVKKKLQNIRKNRKNQTGTNYVPFIPTEKAPRLTQRNTESLAALLPVNYEIFPLILAPIFSSAKAECKYMLSANMLNPACRWKSWWQSLPCQSTSSFVWFRRKNKPSF